MNASSVKHYEELICLNFSKYIEILSISCLEDVSYLAKVQDYQTKYILIDYSNKEVNQSSNQTFIDIKRLIEELKLINILEYSQ